MKEKLLAHLGKYEVQYIVGAIALGLLFLGWVIA